MCVAIPNPLNAKLTEKNSFFTRSAEEIDLIEKLREIDAKILELAKQRCALLSQSSLEAQKEGHGFASLREMQSLQSDRSEGDFGSRLLRYVSGLTYQTAVMRQSIAYLGPEFSYSYSATAKYFGAIDGLQAVSSIGAVFEEIERGHAKYGVVPIENSTDGRIVDTLNMFIKTPLRICGEVMLPIHHNLLARCKREEIREIYSKPQALSQCRAWLGSHLPEARWVEVASTATAAKIAAEAPNAAAVASREAGIAHGLDLIAASIEDNPNNVTRFVIIGGERVPPTGDDKTSIMFQVPHKPGALADVMVLLRDNGLNLTWIESFPVPGVTSEYYFFVELEGHESQPNVQVALQSLRRTALRLDLLGSYPKAREACQMPMG